jgi:acyl-coenzyme A synthetase/AMP-(fatty) acid ligase
MSDLDLNDVCAALWRHVSVQPGAPALVSGLATTTYGELGGLVLSARQRVAGLGLSTGDPVAILVDKSPEAIALVLACLDTGRPFLLPSPKLDTRSLAALFEQSGCVASFRGDGWLPATVELHHPTTSATGQASDVSFMLTTSGSTGLPKIVPITNRAVRRFGAWARGYFGIVAQTTVLNYAPLNFDLCFLDIWATLTAGGRVVLVSADEGVRPARIAELVVAHGVELIQAVPMCFELLSDVETTFPGVRAVAFTGDVIGSRTLANLPRQFPDARVFNIYGCTETNDSFVHELSPRDFEVGRVPIGEPIDGVRALVVDSDGAVVSAGPGVARGELVVATPFQSSGYLDSRRDAGKFVADPTGSSPDTFFRTGDLVERDASGTTVLVGRSDFQVKIRGVAVNTATIEQVLLEHAEVTEAAVVAVADPLAGHRLQAAVHRRPASGLHSLTLRKHCAERLPRAAIPSVMTILDHPLPRTPTGKPDRRALIDLGREAPAPSPPAHPDTHINAQLEESHHVQ